MARQQLAKNTKYTLGIRKLYIHKSRHKHAIRRLRELEGKFLTKDNVTNN